MHHYEFQLRITPDQFLDYYRGTAKQVLVQATTGQRVQFPANLLQKFITQDGISGKFRLTCDDQHKVIGLERLKA